MEKEISTSVHISVALILISAVCGIVIYTIIVGNQMKQEAIDKATDMQVGVSTSQLSSLAGTTKIIPKAAAFAIIVQEEQGIRKLTYNTIESDPFDPARELAKSLDGKVEITVSKVEKGYYDIIIKDYVE